jgi:hypothetical protein
MKATTGKIMSILLGLMLLGSTAMGQNMTCSETLIEAQNRFKSGDFYSIPAILKPCLDNGFSDQQKVEAYWLLTQTYLFLDDPISAEDSYLKLLKKDPLYEVDEDLDPIDVVYLSKKFTTRPKFVISGHFGVNTTLIDVIHPYSLSQNEGEADYSGKIGIQGGMGLEFVLTDNLSIGTELNVVQRGYTFSKQLFVIDFQEFTETQTLLDVPLFVRYRFKAGKFFPYAYTGIGVHYLLNARGDVILYDRFQASGESLSEGNLSEFQVEGPALDLMDQRNSLTYSFVAGGGILIPVKYNFLKVDLRLVQGMKNNVREDNHYGNDELIFRYAYIDDFKRLNNFMLTVGFVKPLYKPRKIKTRR